MSPLQKIAMGLVFMTVPAGFDIGGYVWDGLPDPLGWLLVISGVGALLATTELDLEWIRATALVALAVSIPQWVPPVFESLLPNDNATAEASIKWAFFLPQAAFLVLLARAIAKGANAQEPRDRAVGGRFGVLASAAVALIVLPPVAYGVDDKTLVDSATIAIGIVDVVFVYQLFRWHRRPWLGGEPLLVRPRRGKDEGRPTSE